MIADLESFIAVVMLPFAAIAAGVVLASLISLEILAAVANIFERRS